MILHLGCGSNQMPGAINIDVVESKATDLVMDLKEKLPYTDNTIDSIHAHHFIEHFIPNEFLVMLKDWHRVLKPGGRIVLSLPDVGTAMEEIAQGNTHPDYMKCVYGDPNLPFHSHKWGWKRNTLQEFIAQINFKDIKVTKLHTQCTIPILKAEAIK